MKNGDETQRTSADIVVCIDVTGSMGPAIERLRTHVGKLFAVLSGPEVSVDWRVRLIAYRDLNNDEPIHAYPFTNSVDEFQGWLSDVQACGGGDEPESTLDALFGALQSTWRQGATRHIVVFTDATCHPRLHPTTAPGEQSGGVQLLIDRAASAGASLLLYAPQFDIYDTLTSRITNAASAQVQQGCGLVDLDFAEMVRSVIEVVAGRRAIRGISPDVRILFLAANPADSTRLRIDNEIRSIDIALRQSDFRHRFDLKQHWAVRPLDLQACLLRYTPHIVHFSGHGSGSHEIIVEHESGGTHAISPGALGRLFEILQDNVRCVILNACYSEPQAAAIADHVECVVGMEESIPDAAANSFSSAFYLALGHGRSLKTAFDLGCLQIDLENTGGPGIPRMIAKHGDPGKIFIVSNAARLAAG